MEHIVQFIYVCIKLNLNIIHPFLFNFLRATRCSFYSKTWSITADSTAYVIMHQ